MPFDEIPGNDPIKKALTHMIIKGKVGHSLLFAGPQEAQMFRFAQEFATLLMTQNDSAAIHKEKLEKGAHPDLRVYRPEGKIGMHSIESLRSFSEEVYQAPHEAPWKVFVIQEAERMLPTSANALLKTLEEPLKTSLIILLSSHPERLLPTIVSRLRTLYFQGTASKAHANAQLQQVLLRGGFVSYKEMKEVIQSLTLAIEKTADENEEVVLENLSASQKEMIQKEMQGAITMKYLSDVNQLFATIFMWYRDLELLLCKGSIEHLFFQELYPQLEEALQMGVKPLDWVEKCISEAKLAVDRFLPLSHCLETLFIKLELV